MTPRKIAALGVAIAIGVVAVVGVVAMNPVQGVGAMPGDDGGESTPDAAPAGTTVVTEGDALALDAAADQTIRGRTDLAAGTELIVRMRSTGQNPFIRSVDVTVGEDGTFAATVDLSNVPGDASFEVVVIHDGEELASANGTVSA